MLICIACRPVSCISESAVILLLQNKKQTKWSHRRISLPAYVCHEKFTLILFRMIRILYEYYLPFMTRHTLWPNVCLVYSISVQRKCCYVLLWAAKGNVQKSCLTICDWWENALFIVPVLNQGSFLESKWRKRYHLHFFWARSERLANILGLIMLFGLNGWHDLTKGHFNSCITPEKFSPSKSTRFRYIVMHIKESKTMKGLGSASFLLEGVNLHQKNKTKLKNGTFSVFKLVASLPWTLKQNLPWDRYLDLWGRKRCV